MIRASFGAMSSVILRAAVVLSAGYSHASVAEAPETRACAAPPETMPVAVFDRLSNGATHSVCFYRPQEAANFDSPTFNTGEIDVN
jgi:hypothetical protein